MPNFNLSLLRELLGGLPPGMFRASPMRFRSQIQDFIRSQRAQRAGGNGLENPMMEATQNVLGRPRGGVFRIPTNSLRSPRFGILDSPPSPTTRPAPRARISPGPAPVPAPSETRPIPRSRVPLRSRVPSAGKSPGNLSAFGA